MATSLPQTDNAFTGRTAFQPALPISPAAGGEKTLNTENELKKPIPPEKPAPRPAVISSSVTPPAKEDKATDKATPALTDWGLRPKKRTFVTKFKVVIALGTLAASVAGYFGYDRYLSKSASSGSDMPDAGDMADSDGPNQNDAVFDGSNRDPFEDTLAAEIDQDPQAGLGSEPRKMRSVPNAVPIAAGRNASGRSPGKPSRNALSLDDESLDLDTDSEDSMPPAMTQSEPDLDSDDRDDVITSPVRNRSPAGQPRAGTAGDAARSQSAASRSRDASGGPRLSAHQSRDNDFADDFSDEKLEGYDVAQYKHAKTAHSAPAKSRISVINVEDEPAADGRFDGYTSEDRTSRRAVSKTKVIRAADAASNHSPRGSLDDDDFLDEAPQAPEIHGRGTNEARNDVREFTRPSRDGMNAIQRRGSPPLPPSGSEFRVHRQFTESSLQPEEPASDMYRVVPGDNFWKISQNQYGTARYFQALTRHNQDRVPDPQKLKPGTAISTPSVALLEKRYPDLIEKSAPAGASGPVADPKETRPRFERPISDSAAERAFDGVAGKRSQTDTSVGYFYSKSGEPMYRVGSDDTLTGIAQRHLGRASRWTEIYDQNRDVLKSPNDLTLGTVIRLPDDASRLSLVPESERRR
jgi:nucleoid-associated protein YgaU